MKTTRYASLAFVLCLSSSLLAGDWPQWRGPNRTDVSDESGLLRSWPEGGPRRLWLFRDCGVGYSGPAVVGNRLYIMGARKKVEQLLAIDVEKGTTVWASDVGDVLSNNWGDGPRGTPTVDGRAVYALSGRGTLICVAARNGKLAWKREMKEFGGETPGWGYTESVLVDGNLVLCTPGGRQGAIVALDKRNGKLVWQSKGFTDDAQYSSIIPIDFKGKRLYVQLTQESVVGLAQRTGDVVWRGEWQGETAVIPTPIYHDGHVYVTSGYGVGCGLFAVGEGTVPNVYDEGVRKVMKNHHGGVILVGNHLYGYSDGRGWICQEFKSGEAVWSEKGALGKGAIAYADGMLYCLEESSGTVVLAEASPESWSEKGRFKLEPQSEIRNSAGMIWTHPVIANGRLYLRDQDLLFCYDVEAK